MDAARIVDGRVRVESAGLEQEHADVAAVDEAARHHGSRRAAPDDDHVGMELRHAHASGTREAYALRVAPV